MDVVIVGSGPSAAAVALALRDVANVNITVLDFGGELEPDRVIARTAMAQSQPQHWGRSHLDLLAASPTAVAPGKIPVKQIYGSNFPFENFGQLDDVDAAASANGLVISGAYGGFSNTWGAQVMPYSTGTFRTWPVTRQDLEPHYRQILNDIPYSAQSDDLEEVFPLFGSPDDLPTVSARTSAVLNRYERRRIAVRRHGVTAGHARLALRGSACKRCGLCMTGCPYEFIYSASQTFDELRIRGRVKYHSGLKVFRVAEPASGTPTVFAVEVATGRIVTFSADRVFLGAGAIGTTRIVAGSLGLTDQKIQMVESVQFMMPFLSLRPTPDLTQDGEFTLNQFNLFATFDSDGKDAALVHCYPYNDIMLASLPALLLKPPLRMITSAGLRRLTIGLGYLPSWDSPSVELEIGAQPPGDGQLPPVHVTSRPNDATGPAIKKVIRQLRRTGRALDLHPIPGQTKLSGAAKSYHYGGTFAMSHMGPGDFTSDTLGRVGHWRNVHLVDGSIFPTVPATTFTLTVMANAHRIASQAVGDS